MRCHAFHHPVELLNTLLPSGLPPHKLVLKVGAPVVFIRNLNREQGIMNGTRGVIQSSPRELIIFIFNFFFEFWSWLLCIVYFALGTPEVPFAGPIDQWAEGRYIRICATD